MGVGKGARASMSKLRVFFSGGDLLQCASFMDRIVCPSVYMNRVGHLYEMRCPAATADMQIVAVEKRVTSDHTRGKNTPKTPGLHGCMS